MPALTSIEHERTAQWREAQNRSRSQRHSKPGAKPESAPDDRQAPAGITTAAWVTLFLAAGALWLLGLALNFLIPAVTFIMNYCTVLGLWMWAEMNRLKPPSFGSAIQKVSGKSAAVNEVPGSTLLYALLGGITPLVYLTALWWNNRP